MKRFLIYIAGFVTLPIILLVGIYLLTDPFRCMYAFDIQDTDVTNREYLSTELFLRNQPNYHYNSFVFSSSRGGGINTYTWRMYLPNNAQPFLFQAWSESLTGIELKIDYLDRHNIPIENALVLMDIPGVFAKEQLPTKALSMKHYIFTGESKYTYNFKQFCNFIQKPSFVIQKINSSIQGNKVACETDTISNDWDTNNKYNFAFLPPQDSLKKCSKMTRTTFFSQIEHSRLEVSQSQPLINEQYLQQLQHIKAVFDRKCTDYYIILTPAYCYTSSSVNVHDLKILQDIFGVNRVYNFTNKNFITEDYNNFSDPGHFDLHTGYLILQNIYAPQTLTLDKRIEQERVE